MSKLMKVLAYLVLVGGLIASVILANLIPVMVTVSEAYVRVPVQEARFNFWLMVAGFIVSLIPFACLYMLAIYHELMTSQLEAIQNISDTLSRLTANTGALALAARPVSSSTPIIADAEKTKREPAAFVSHTAAKTSSAPNICKRCGHENPSWRDTCTQCGEVLK